MDTNPFAPACISHHFGSGRLDVNTIPADTTGCSHISTHLINERCQFGPLTNDSQVSVTDGKLLFLNEPDDLLQELYTADILVLRILVRKMTTNISSPIAPSRASIKA